MGLSVAKLLGLKDKLQKAKWYCEYEGGPWEVTAVDLDFEKNVFRLECRIEKDEVTHELKVVEHYEGGGDYLLIDCGRYDADHHLDIATKPLKRTIKVKVKTEYDVEPDEGYEKVLRLWCKLKIKIL